MLASITPLGERGRGNRWWLTASAYEAGSAVGGAAVGLAAGALGLALRHTVLASAWSRAGVAAVVTLAALAVDLSAGRRAIPTWHRQVDKAWLDRYRGWVYGAGFGVQLGLGVVTIVNSAATYAFIGLAAMVASPWWGALVGAVFGVARAAPLLAFGRAEDFGSLQSAHRRLSRLAGASRSGTVAILAAGSVALAVTAAAATH